MVNYLTLKLADNKETYAIFDYLCSNRIQFWYMHKNNSIRLRIPKYSYDIVADFLNSHNLEFARSVYEPEINLFGGEKSIDIIHNILCDSATFFWQAQKYNCFGTGEYYCTCLYFLNYMLDCCGFDQFEMWDVWNKVCYFREIDLKTSNKILLSKLYDVYCAISDEKYSLRKFSNIIIMNSLSDIKANCKELKEKSFQNEFSRGVRGIMSSVLIFDMNMAGMSGQLQCAFSNILRFLKNPDFRKELEL